MGQNQPDMQSLVTSFMGAQIAGRFIEQAWEAASPEAKRSLADALVDAVRNDMAANGYRWRDAVEKQVVSCIMVTAEPRIMEIIGPPLASIDMTLPARVAEKMEEYAKSTIQSAFEESSKRFLKTFGEALRSAS